MSLEPFEPSFTTEKKTKKELKMLETKLINEGFDTVLFIKVIGIKDEIAYKKNYYDYDSAYRKFSEDYLK